MRHSKKLYNVLGTETESFPIMQNTCGSDYKSFEKQKEILENITYFGKNLVQIIK